MNNVKELLPIGSVVILREGQKRLMTFGIKQQDMRTGTEYDYLGVIYPEGNIGQGGQFFFNHADIEQVFLPALLMRSVRLLSKNFMSIISRKSRKV